MRHLIDPADFTLEETLRLMDLADRIHDDPAAYRNVAERKRLASLFYEPSTRTRLSFEAAMEQLKGVTLESIVISTRTARAVRRLIALGKAKAEDFPLLLHIDDIINGGAEVNIPWAAFETETIL